MEIPRGSLLAIDSRGEAVGGGGCAVLGGADAVQRFVAVVHAVTEPLDGLEHQLVVMGAAHGSSHDGGLLRGGLFAAGLARALSPGRDAGRGGTPTTEPTTCTQAGRALTKRRLICSQNKPDPSASTIHTQGERRHAPLTNSAPNRAVPAGRSPAGRLGGQSLCLPKPLPMSEPLPVFPSRSRNFRRDDLETDFGEAARSLAAPPTSGLAFPLHLRILEGGVRSRSKLGMGDDFSRCYSQRTAVDPYGA